MRNRLKSATGLALSPTLIFDYPNSAQRWPVTHRELVGTSEQQTSVVGLGAEIQRVVDRFRSRPRQAGALNCCSRWQMKPTATGSDSACVTTEKRHRGHGPRRPRQRGVAERRRAGMSRAGDDAERSDEEERRT
jgi:hypothetical protein